MKSLNLSAGRIFAWFIGTIYFKFLLFDLIWAFATTFSGFQFPLGYLTKLMFATLLAAPLLAVRSRWWIVGVCVALDAWLVANLMYFRTYYTVIPLSSYLLAGNLADFTDSVTESLRWTDLLFPLTTAALAALVWRAPFKSLFKGHIKPLARTLSLLFLIPAAIVALWITVKGGYKKAYEDLLYDYSTCGAAVYTIPGTWVYEQVSGASELTPEVREHIESWLDKRPGSALPDSVRNSIKAPDNIIIILAESLESWVIGTKVDGIEITPHLNRLVAEDSTLYAPNMLTQVRGARSIDAQLLMHTGLFPVAYGAYSYRFPHTTYPSLDKAWKERHPDGVSASFTVDKKIVWNAVIAAQDFGIDILLDKPHFTLDAATGPRHRLGDHSLLRQSAERIEGEEILKTGGHTLLQIVTYSGHTPFIIPDSLRHITIDERFPKRLKRYLEVANYTDSAIGAFVDRVRSNPKMANTMIVITGDHEGIGADRAEWLTNPEIASFMSAGQFTPLIAVNSPVGLKYDKVFGQIDMYPTLLDIAGLDSYPWRGMGRSILDPGKKPFAVTPAGEIIGDASEASTEEIEHAKEGYTVADVIISTNYFKSNDIKAE
ncbi:MAG: LTA synthase family protein [[Clostridium] fimetarium]|nr:LTA synthase family protein [Alistipes timonensis]MCM1405288.1 LTA synthase family protein [[Clostridium] fimetarium]